MMTVETKTSNGTENVTISVSGVFDFQLHDDLRMAYLDTNGPSAKYVVDFSKIDGVGSSAFGMLLLLRDHAGGSTSDITILHASGIVKKALDVANVSKLFNL
jgi:anti-anti-sigma regulatory factor